MNFLDAGIIILTIAFFINGAVRSSIYWLIVASGVFGGYISGLLLAPSITRSIPSDLKKGFVSLALIFGLALSLGFIARMIARRVRAKILLSGFAPYDKALTWPCKIIIVLGALFILAQSLIYVPILGLQFEAQGSSLFMMADKLSPSTYIEISARKISPDQFQNIRLRYNSEPLTYNALEGAGPFRQTLKAAAPAIVKISGRNCVGIGSGSGFVAAPGLVITNAHVLSGASSVYIRDHAGAYPATPVLIDNDYDIAVLYSRFISDSPLPLGPGIAAPGTEGVSLGYPQGGDLQIARGVVSSQQYKSTHNKLNGSNTIEFSGSLGEGSSGGPILDGSGKVIGVNDAGGGGKSIAISSEVASRLLDKAKSRFVPASTDLCAVPPKFY